MLRPPYWPGRNSPAHDGSRFVLLDLARSADPPMNHGIFLAIAFSVLPELSRVPIPLASAGGKGMSLCPRVGGCRAFFFWRVVATARERIASPPSNFGRSRRRLRPRLTLCHFDC